MRAWVCWVMTWVQTVNASHRDENKRFIITYTLSKALQKFKKKIICQTHLFIYLFIYFFRFSRWFSNIEKPIYFKCNYPKCSHGLWISVLIYSCYGQPVYLLSFELRSLERYILCCLILKFVLEFQSRHSTNENTSPLTDITCSFRKRVLKSWIIYQY